MQTPEPDVDAGQLRWPTYNLSTWEVKAAVPEQTGGGGQLRDPASIYMEKDTWHQAQASLKTHLDLSHTCPHMCKHSYVRTHAYHIHAQDGVRGRETPFLHSRAFLGSTSIRLNLFFYCFFCVTTQHWLDTEKGPSPTRATRKQTESPRPLLGPGTATVAWWCGQEVRACSAGFAPRRNFQVPLSHSGLASRSRGSSCTAPVQLWALNRRKANKGSMPSHTLTFPGNK